VRKPYARPLVALLALLALTPGVLLRLASIGFNDLPHGDVLIDALAAESLARDGRFAVPLVLVSSSASGRGAETLLDYRRPLWPLLAAPLVGLSGDGYHAARVLSFISGLALLWVAYAAFRDLFGRSDAVAALACCTYSYLLVDFSGNGSLYQLQALFFLAFILLVGRVDRTPFTILTGVVVAIPLLFMGSLVTETFFGIPGLGSYTIDAINSQDFAIVRAMVFLGSVLYIVGLILTDISYTLVDPRVRFE